MKLYSFILIIYALFLTLSPGLEKVFENMNESCCLEVNNEGANHDSDNSSDNNHCSTCSPFSSCHCSLLFTSNEAIELVSVKPSQTERKSYSNLSIPPTIVFTIWQPPKIA